MTDKMKHIASLLTSFLCVAAASVAQFHNPVTFNVVQKRVADNALEVVFEGRVEAGWHVYATDIAEGGPTRAELTLVRQKGLKPDGNLRATGKVQRTMDSMFGMEVSYMEETASFSQRFTITEPGYEVAGYLTYGACNDENCLPPTDVEFSFKGDGPLPASGLLPASTKGEGNETAEADKAKAPETSENSENSECSEYSENPEGSEYSQSSSSSAINASPSVGDSEASLWSPVIDELKAFEEGNPSLPTGEGTGGQEGLWSVFLLGLLGGLIALLTPCVWPVIPMTVSFFLKRAGNRKRGIRDAVTYGISIVVIYLMLGLLVTLIFGASALNALSTNAYFNIFFFLMLLAFGASLLGGFEMTLPGSWTNAVDRRSGTTKGLPSIFLMAFTLSLVSFSCTGPIIGFLLVEISSSGALLAPAVGMLGFALALALPFTLFALFPAWLRELPRSGNWMNRVKVCLGLLEIAFALKFFSVADQAYHWHLMDREVFLSLWIVIFAFMGAYLVGWIRLPHDEDEYDEAGEVIQHPRTGVARLFMALMAFAFALYMMPGLWGAPCKAVSAFAPPMQTQDFVLGEQPVEAHFNDYDEGMLYAAANHKPVMLDFTGYGCVNCRKMEADVWTDPQVSEMMREKYILITLHVDDRTPLPKPVTVRENGADRTITQTGKLWTFLQGSKFGANAQPFYVLVDNEGHPLSSPYYYKKDVAAFRSFLEKGLQQYRKRQ